MNSSWVSELSNKTGFRIQMIGLSQSHSDFYEWSQSKESMAAAIKSGKFRPGSHKELSDTGAYSYGLSKGVSEKFFRAVCTAVNIDPDPLIEKYNAVAFADKRKKADEVKMRRIEKAIQYLEENGYQVTRPEYKC